MLLTKQICIFCNKELNENDSTLEICFECGYALDNHLTNEPIRNAQSYLELEAKGLCIICSNINNNDKLTICKTCELDTF